jgi:hypothetical protein
LRERLPQDDKKPKKKKKPNPFTNLTPYNFPNESTLERLDFLYGHHLLRATVSLSAGLGGTGKSSKAIVEALAMASGKPLLGIQPAGCLRVLLVNLEGTHKHMDLRIAAAMKLHRVRKKEVGGRLFVIAKRELKLAVAKFIKGDICTDDPAIAKLVDFLKANKIDVLSIDPLRKTHRVRESDNGDMGVVVEVYEDIAEAADCAVHLWHHNRKGNSGETTMDSARGASALIDAPRSAEILETLPETLATKLGVESDQRRFYFRSYNGKINFAPPSEQSNWFELQNVTLINGDHIAVVTSWKPPAGADLLTPEVITEIKTKVDATNWREDSRAEMWVGKAIGAVLGLDPVGQKAIIKEVLKSLLKSKVLKQRPGKDDQRRDRIFIEVA